MDQFTKALIVLLFIGFIVGAYHNYVEASNSKCEHFKNNIVKHIDNPHYLRLDLLHIKTHCN